MMSDWKKDLSLLRSKAIREKHLLASRTAGKENDAGSAEDGTSSGIRRSINVNDEALAIVDPTIAMYTESTPKFKALRSFGGLEGGHSLIDGEGSASTTKLMNENVLSPTVHDENSVNGASNGVAVALFSSTAQEETPPRDSAAVPPQKKSDSPPTPCASSSKYKTPTRIPLPKGGLSVSPTTPKDNSDFGKMLDTNTKVGPPAVPMTTGSMIDNLQTPSPPVAVSVAEELRSRTAPEQRYGRDKSIIGRMKEFQESRAASKDDAEISKSGRAFGKDLGDEWKEAQTPGGRRYFYNRRTRKSSWKLPPSAFTLEVGGSQRIFTAADKPRTDIQTGADMTPLRVSEHASKPNHATPPSVDPQQRQRDLKRHEEVSVSLIGHTDAADRKPPSLPQSLPATLAAAAALGRSTDEDPSASATTAFLYCPFCAAAVTIPINPVQLDESYASPNAEARMLMAAHMRLCANAPKENQDLIESLAATVSDIKFSPEQNQSEERILPQGVSQTVLSGPSMEYSGSHEVTAVDMSTTVDQDATTEVEVCEECGRKFAQGRLASHAKVCRSVFKEKRTPYDVRRKRLVGTPMEFTALESSKLEATPKKDRRSIGGPGSASRNRGMSPSMKGKVASPAHTKNDGSFACPYCASGKATTREELMKHMRSCVNDEKLEEHAKLEKEKGTTSFEGDGQARAACPFCAKPTNMLSAHLLRCEKRKEVHQRRTQAGVPNLFSSTPQRTGRVMMA